MDYESNEHLTGRHFDKETGNIEIYSGRVGDKEFWDKTNIKNLPNLESCLKSNYGDNDCRVILTPDWRENVPFEAILTYIGYSRGRSAADLEFQDAAGHKFQMFMSDFNELLLSTNIINRKTELIRWKFCKKGQNYGLQFLEKVAKSDRLTSEANT